MSDEWFIKYEKNMADDYIGKKMEDYRRGVTAGSYRRKLTPSGARPGTWSVKFPPRRVFVTGGSAGVGLAVVKALSNAGCTVSFCGIDAAQGNSVAQSTGSQFVCVDSDQKSVRAALDRVIAARHGIDVVVNCVPELAELMASVMATYYRGLSIEPDLSGRFINIATSSAQANDVRSVTLAIAASMSDCPVTVNAITSIGSDEEMAAFAVFLCSPVAGFLSIRPE